MDKLTSLDGTVVSSVLFDSCGLLDPQGLSEIEFLHPFF